LKEHHFGITTPSAGRRDPSSRRRDIEFMSVERVTLVPPYLLFLGDVRDPRQAKTATGLYYWRKDECLAQLRLPGCAADCGLPDLNPGEAVARGAKSLLIGLAPIGGEIPDSWLPSFEAALRAGLDLVSGMHVRLGDAPRLRDLARQCGRSIIDVRAAPSGLPVANGRRRTGKRLLTVGTDCGVGKMFAALSIEREMVSRGIHAEFRATGQTGIMIAGSGICVDAVVSDFTAGAAEVLSPDSSPEHWDIIEGQGSLFHPSFAGVTLSLLHGSQPDYLVMCHDAPRQMMVGIQGYPVPSIEQCIETNLVAGRLVNADVSVIGICVNTSTLSDADARAYLRATAQRVGLPACDPVRTGVAAIVDRLI
jgi:uncharacterized NAD-dependent epimerase/dehydratase family protein